MREEEQKADPATPLFYCSRQRRVVRAPPMTVARGQTRHHPSLAATVPNWPPKLLFVISPFMFMYLLYFLLLFVKCDKKKMKKKGCV